MLLNKSSAGQTLSHERAQNAQSLSENRFVTFVLLCGIHTFEAKPLSFFVALVQRAGREQFDAASQVGEGRPGLE